MTPSVYQAAIYAAATTTRSNIVIAARAGCGKTSTIIGTLRALEAAKRIPASSILCAFNAAIRDELKARAPEWCEVKTMHQVGLAALRAAGIRAEVQTDGFPHARRLACATMPDAIRPVGDLPPREREQREAHAVRPFLAFLRRLVGLAQNCGVGLEGATVAGADLAAVATKYALDFPDGLDAAELCEWGARWILAVRDARGAGGITFDDMVWLPGALGLPCASYDLVCVDEAQDVNPAQLYLIRSMLRRKGRLIAVGDDRQAIYGWRGAGEGVLGEIAETFAALVLPLPRTYRCTASIVAEAARLVPDYEGHRVDPGIVRDVDFATLEREAMPGDYVLSRTNAPLAKLCLAWLRRGVPAAIAGRDIAASLAALIEESGEETINGLIAWANARANRAIEALRKEPENESKAAKADRYVDEAETIAALAEGQTIVRSLLGRIAFLFVDPVKEGAARPVVLLSTTHKAKGLERDRVWLLRDTYARSRWRKDGERWIEIPPTQEEWNLLYVAITRARDVLCYVREPSKKEGAR